jgi:NAD(P)-dependent dehydrogenase (short-subunit alcohol dehydrogenase family)
MELELEGKTVLVTGGSDGLGRALCRRLVAEGAAVAFCGRDAGRIDATTDELLAAGGDVAGVIADVSKPEDIVRFVDTALERWGRIDGVVNNAGQTALKALIETTDQDFDDDLALKLYAAARLCRLALPHLAREGGSIVNVLSTTAKAPTGGSMPTSVSRAAGMALTKALSKEVGSDNIRVNAVLIGLVESGQWVRRAAAAGVPVEQLYQDMGKSSGIPLGRVGRAEEFADLVAFLLSPRAGYVSGTAINLDGGLSAVV